MGLSISRFVRWRPREKTHATTKKHCLVQSMGWTWEWVWPSINCKWISQHYRIFVGSVGRHGPRIKMVPTGWCHMLYSKRSHRLVETVLLVVWFPDMLMLISRPDLATWRHEIFSLWLNHHILITKIFELWNFGLIFSFTTSDGIEMLHRARSYHG